MISCDLCGEWYHMRCVGVTQSQARTLKKYTCPVCVAVKVGVCGEQAGCVAGSGEGQNPGGTTRRVASWVSFGCVLASVEAKPTKCLGT